MKTKHTQVQQQQSTASTTGPILGTAGSAFAQAIAGVQAAEQAAPGLITLDPAAKRAVVRVRKGGQKLIPQMILAAQAFPNFVPAGIDPQAMLDALAYLDQVQQLETVITAFLGTVEDTNLKATADLWIQALDIYAALSRKVSSDGKVGDYLAGMIAFLAKNPSAAPDPTGGSSNATPPVSAGTGTGSTSPASGGTGSTASGSAGTGSSVPVYTPSGEIPPAANTASTTTKP